MSVGSTAVLADQTAEDVSSAHVFRIDGLPRYRRSEAKRTSAFQIREFVRHGVRG
jgi:hypothetical protein